MTCSSQTTNEQYHTAPQQNVQSTPQQTHNTRSHTPYIMRCLPTELRTELLSSNTNSTRGLYYRQLTS